MKYYLETNALRALGSAIGKNNDLLSVSYTSIFSIFEIIKGINFDCEIDNKENIRRKNIFRAIDDTNISTIPKMPYEMIFSAFSTELSFDYYSIIAECLDSIRNNEKIDTSKLKEISSTYENSKAQFKNIIKRKYNIKEEEKKYITIKNLNDYIVRDGQFFPNAIKDFLKEDGLLKTAIEILENSTKISLEGDHPSRAAIEFLKKKDVVYLYRAFFKDYKKTDEEIFSLYTGGLDLFIFASFSYELQKKILRLEAENNDFLDIKHCLYLTNKDQCIVTDDKIFNFEGDINKKKIPKGILPSINVIPVSEYRKLI